MRRNVLHVSLALFTFACGFIAAGHFDGIATALILATLFFTSIKFFRQHETGRHYLKIAVLTLLIWIPFAWLALSFGDEMLGTMVPDNGVEFVCPGTLDPPAERKGEVMEDLSIDYHQITPDGNLGNRAGQNVLVDVKFSDSHLEFHRRRTVTCR